MSLSHEFCPNLRLSLSEIEAKHAKLVELLAKINETGSVELFNEAIDLKHQIEADFEAIPSLKAIEFLKTFEGKYTLHHFDLKPKTGDQYLAELKTAGMSLGVSVEHLLRTMPILKKSEQCEVVVIKISDLGFTSGPNKEDLYKESDDVYKKAKELGLEICLPQIGPEYRLKYQDQPINTCVYIGMEPIADRDHHYQVFGVRRAGAGLALNTYRGNDSAIMWKLDCHVAFRLSE